MMFIVYNNRKKSLKHFLQVIFILTQPKPGLNKFAASITRGVTGVLQRAEMGYFGCGNQSSFLRNTDSVFIQDPCG